MAKIEKVFLWIILYLSTEMKRKVVGLEVLLKGIEGYGMRVIFKICMQFTYLYVSKALPHAF